MPSRSVLTAELFNRHNIVNKVDATTYRQGEALYFRSGVWVDQCRLHGASVSVHDGARVHQVAFTMLDGAIQPTCECDKAKSTPGVWCKHSVAASLALYSWLYQNPPVTWNAQVEKLIESRPKKAAAANDQLLTFSLDANYAGWVISAWLSSVKALDSEQIDDLLACRDPEKYHLLLKSTRPAKSTPDPSRVINGTPELIAAAGTCALMENMRLYGKDRSAAISNMLPILKDAPLFRGAYGNPFVSPVRISTEMAESRLVLSEEEDGLRLRPELVIDGQSVDVGDKAFSVIVDSPAWVYAGGTVARVDTSRIDLGELADGEGILVPDEDRQEFLDTYLGPLAERAPLVGSSLQWTEVREEARPRLYLSQNGEDVYGVLKFGYGEFEASFQAASGGDTVRRRPGAMELVRVVRDWEREESFQKELLAHGMRRGKAADEFLLRARTNVLEFLMRGVPRLIEAGFEVYGEEQIKSARVNRSRPRISFDVGSGIDWFDIKISVDFDGVRASLKEIKSAIRRKEKYVKLGDGTYGQLPEDWLEQYRRLFVFGEVGDDSVKLKKSQALLLDMLFAESTAARYEEGVDSALARLRSFDQVKPAPLPEGLEAELRPYQKAGYDWLHFLREYGFGGCLADDMGLGKTVQALAMLLWVKRNPSPDKSGKPGKPAPSLVVVPRSLIVNWQREAARFAPDLKILANADSGRARDTKVFANYDVILMTYGTMLRDIGHLSKYRFRYAVLDESQTIKNPAAQVSKAARLLSAENRLTLTGTPIENSTLDLWSQFDFLNPGLLGTLEQFKSEFAVAIEREQSDAAAAFLRRMVFPFILRRTKDQVAPELPPRTERVIVTDMDSEQRALYDKYRNHYRGMLLGMIDTGGMQNARIRILEGLLRLRQIANHPKLVERETAAGSVKLETLMETLTTLKSEGHKVLVFSQFVQMLRLIKDELEKTGFRYEYLTGQTSNRQAVVDSFQNDLDVSVLLISLRAGGVGLNLTAADYVIHVDPWWNPAVEMQASDRTHRIGQDKPVFVYKFVVRDTVEDKVLMLQERKRELVTAVVASESSFFKSLNRDDVEVLFD